MEGADLRTRVEEYVRNHYSPAFEHLRSAPELTREEQLENLKEMPERVREFLERHEPPPQRRPSLDDEEVLINQKVSEIMPFVQQWLAPGTGEPSDNDLHKAWMASTRAQITGLYGLMKKHIDSDGTLHPFLQHALDTSEENLADLDTLAEVTTEEELAEIAKRMDERTIQGMPEHLRPKE